MPWLSGRCPVQVTAARTVRIGVIRLLQSMCAEHPCGGQGDSARSSRDRADAGPLLVELTRKIADQFFSLVGIIDLPGLAQHPTSGRMMLFRQAFHDVARLVGSGSAGSLRPNRRCGRSASRLTRFCETSAGPRRRFSANRRSCQCLDFPGFHIFVLCRDRTLYNVLCCHKTGHPRRAMVPSP